MRYPWFKPDCPCIDCECIRLGINPLPGEVMHEMWEKHDENIKLKMKNSARVL